MKMRRILINHAGGTTTDFRVSVGAFDELDRIVGRAVGMPKRALFAYPVGQDDKTLTTVRRALVDAGFSVSELALEVNAGLTTLAGVSRVHEALASAGVTADDLVVALGREELASVAAFAARTWCGGTSSVLLPTTFDAMVTCATAMRPLDAGAAAQMISLPPTPSMVVCDLSFVVSAGAEACRSGYVSMLAAALAGGVRAWDRIGNNLQGLVDLDEVALTDELIGVQTSRRDVLKAASPSARQALDYGVTTARALRGLLGADVPWYRLYAEGMRFESRLATTAADFKVEAVFEQDDRLEALGVEELGFSVDVDAFVEALKAERFKRANRFLFALPKRIGTVRLTTVEEDVLREHAEAYLASRADLLEE